MNKVFLVVLSLIAFGTIVFLYPDGVGAVLIGVVFSGFAIALFQVEAEDREFLTQIFLIGLTLRALFAIFVYIFNLESFFGPDALYYDWLGGVLSNYWSGLLPATYPDLVKISDHSQSGWGMSYLIGIIYYAVGQNTLAVQFFNCVLGAATAPVTYLCSKEIFTNKRVARISSMIVALCPSLIIWSSQGLKDGIIVFFLVVSVVCVLKLQKKLNYFSIIVLMISLMAILSLRFYIFYMLVLAIIGCFAIGDPINPVTLVRRTLILLVIGLALTSLGSTAEQDLSRFNLEKVNSTREDLARGNAGYGRDVDVSTTEGALTALPVGFLYLMLAPFPWQLGNLRQAITLPEMLFWWSSIPFLISGLWYAIRHRLRSSLSVLLFTLMLTVSYSLYQGNIGTAYRQRAQIQIFHFMFIAVGWTLWKEKKENEKLLRKRGR